MTQGLKPCPFCGAEALLTEHEPHDHSPALVALTGVPAKHPGSWTAECVACSCGMIHATLDEVVAAWNNRAAASDPAIADTALSEERIDWIANAHCPGGVAYPNQVKHAIREALREATIAGTAGAKPVARVVYGVDVDGDAYARAEWLTNALENGTLLYLASPAIDAAGASSDDVRDAARYRWLRDQNNSLETRQYDKGIFNGPSCYHEVEGIVELKHGPELDEAIDAAIAKENGNG